MVHFPFAYVGPGAGFAFLGSFFSILLSLLAGIVSLLLWPFRALAGMLRGSPRARVVVLGVDDLDPDVVERMMTEGRLPNLAKLRTEGSYRRLRVTDSGGWAAAAFWKILDEHALDSTVLLVPGTFPERGLRGRRLWRTAGGQIVSQPPYYVKYLERLLGPVPPSGMTLKHQEEFVLSALDHQKRGVLACVFEMVNGGPEDICEVDRIVGRLFVRIGRNDALFVTSDRGALFSNRALDADFQSMENLGPTILGTFGFA